MSEPFGRPGQQPGSFPTQPGPYPPPPGGYPPPPGGYPQQPGPGQQPPKRSRRGLWIGLAAVGVVLVLGIGAGTLVLATKVANNGPGSREPNIPPAIAAPPADPLPARSGQYTQLPAGCSLLSNETVQVLAPGDTTTSSGRHHHQGARSL